MASITMTSEQFEEGGAMPLSAAHPSAGGENRSPQLSWSGVPEECQSLALTCWDPDAPTTVGFSHWVRFDMPPETASLAEGAGNEQGPWIDAITDWGVPGWGGMAPPPGDAPHHYEFTLYALDVPAVGLDEHSTFATFRFMIREHVIATGVLEGRFGHRA